MITGKKLAVNGESPSRDVADKEYTSKNNVSGAEGNGLTAAELPRGIRLTMMRDQTFMPKAEETKIDLGKLTLSVAAAGEK